MPSDNRPNLQESASKVDSNGAISNLINPGCYKFLGEPPSSMYLRTAILVVVCSVWTVRASDKSGGEPKMQYQSRLISRSVFIVASGVGRGGETSVRYSWVNEN